MLSVSPATGGFIVTILLIGLIITLALQILSLSLAGMIAATFFYWRRSQTVSVEQVSVNQVSVEQRATRISPLPHGIGAVLLLTVNGAIWLAGYFAVKLSLVGSPILGAVLGIAIWSAYLLLWMWLGARGMSALLGKGVGMVGAGTRQLFAMLIGQRLQPVTFERLHTQLIAQESRLIELQRQVDQQSQQTAAAIRKTSQPEIHSAATSGGSDLQWLWQQIEQYVRDPAQNLSTQTIRQRVKTLVQQSNLDPATLPPLNRQSIASCLATREDLSSKRQARIIDRLETVWTELIQQSEADSEYSIPSESPEAPQDVLSELGWLGLAALLIQGSFNLLPDEWIGEQLHPKSGEILAWMQAGRQKLQIQVDQFRQQTTQQAQLTQQTVLTIIWWLLATAVTSGLTAAMAGAMAGAMAVR